MKFQSPESQRQMHGSSMRSLAFVLLLPWAGAHAAAPTFVAGTEDNDNGTSFSPANPSGVANGDLAVAWCHINSADGTWSADPDFTEIEAYDTQADVGGQGGDIYVGYTIWDGTSGSYTFNYSGTADNGACSLTAWRDVHGDVWDVTYVRNDHYAFTLSNGNAANAPITTNTDDARVVLLQMVTGTAPSSSGAPSGYDLDLTVALGGFERFQAVASKAVSAAGTETPGAWGHSGFGSSSDSVGVTLAIKAEAKDLSWLRRRR